MLSDYRLSDFQFGPRHGVNAWLEIYEKISQKFLFISCALDNQQIYAQRFMTKMECQFTIKRSRQQKTIDSFLFLFNTQLQGFLEKGGRLQRKNIEDRILGGQHSSGDFNLSIIHNRKIY